MYSGKNVRNRARWLYLDKSGSTQAKVVVFAQKKFYSRKTSCIRAKFLNSGKSGFICAKWLYLGKSGCIRAKVVEF